MHNDNVWCDDLNCSQCYNYSHLMDYEMVETNDIWVETHEFIEKL